MKKSKKMPLITFIVVYIGEYSIAPVHVKAEVSVSNHQITNIEIFQHDNGLVSTAESIINGVVEEQSLDIDAVSGATVSSKCILKAVENAIGNERGRFKQMKTIVIYNSQTGFTKRYAEWIAEATGADCLALSAAKKKDLATYESIIFGGWACAGSISKISWFKGNIDKWTDKKLIAFCVGGSPIDNPEIDIALKRIFNESEQKKVKTFYCPGGFNYEKMSTPVNFQ